MNTFFNKVASAVTTFALLLSVSSPLIAFAAPTTLFSDGFEGTYSNWTSGNPDSGKWEIDNSGHTGKAARVKGDTSTYVYKNVSTVGYNSLTLTYWYKTSGVESGDYVKAEWYDGTSWTTLSTISGSVSTWTLKTDNLPVGANSLSSFKLRFIAHINGGSHKILIDDVVLTGTVINTAPVAQDKSIATNEDTAASSTVLATDSDVPAQTLTYSVVANPTHGALSGFSASTGAFTYTPTANYNGPDSFTFKANDGTADSNTATVSITVNPVNDAPVLGAIGSKSGNELSLLTFTATSSDVDGGTPVFSLSGTVPAGAAIDSSTGVFTWTPTEAQGPQIYSFDVVVSDGALSNSETIAVTVNEVNVAPVSTGASVSTHMNTSKTITLAADDTDIPANTLVYSTVGNPSHGTLGSVSGNEVVYTPDADYSGPDSFTFKVNDGTADSNTATIEINVNNSAPVIAPIAGQPATELVALSLTATATDPDSDPLAFSLGAHPAWVSIDATTGVLTGTPSEPDGGGVYPVTVIVSDGSMTDSTSFDITVAEANVAPVATSNEEGITTPEDTAVTATLDASDSDVPAQTLTFEIVTGPSHGTLGVITGNQVVYTPSTNYNGADSFTFKANDGTADSNMATVDINVTPFNDAPTIILTGDNPMSLMVGGTFTDPGATGSDVEDGTLTVSATGTVDRGTIGAYVLTYTVTDSGELSTSTTRTVNVTAVPPVDVCPNIEGMQETVPAGKELTDAGCIDIPAPAPTPVPTPEGGAVGLGFLGGSHNGGGLVLGASTTTGEDLPASCGAPYLTDYLRMGTKNNPAQVILLQNFLNTNLNENLPVTGFFGPLTHGAVKKFQTENADQILAPWAPYGLTKQTPTGYVYKTTKRWINLLQCKTLDIPMPQLP